MSLSQLRLSPSRQCLICDSCPRPAGHRSLPSPPTSVGASWAACFFCSLCVSDHHWRLLLSWAGKTWVRLVLAVCCSGFGCPPPAQVPRDALQAPELTPSDTREPASALGTGNKFLPWALEDTCSWEPGAPSSALGGTQLGKRFLSKRPRVLQTPTTQLLAGEVLPGVLQALRDSCASQEPMRLHAVPFAARQDSCTHHDPSFAAGLWLAAG